jgi:acetolactate synthase-1/2/3 large subunit
VAVEIPVDVLESVGEQTPKIEVLVSAKRPNRGDLDKAIGLLNKAEHPIIVSGGGVLRAGGWQQLQALAERLRAPVVMSTHGQGALSSEHPLAFSSLAGEKLIPEADVILAVGTRFALTYGSRRPVKPEQVLVSINIDPEEFVRGPKASVAIEADATQALASISESVHQRDSSEWRNLDRVRAEVRGLVGEMQPQAAYGAAIRDALPDDAIVVSGMTQVGYWCRVGYPVRQPRTMLSSGYQGTLGFEYPTGLGAQVGRPDTRVVVIAGDGGFLFGVQELATAAQHNIPAICIVFNDQAYGSVKRIQQRRFGRLISSELRNPDFVLLGESFGVKSVRATGPQELGLALKQALSYCGPVLIEVPTGEMDDPVPLTRRA